MSNKLTTNKKRHYRYENDQRTRSTRNKEKVTKNVSQREDEEKENFIHKIHRSEEMHRKKISRDKNFREKSSRIENQKSITHVFHRSIVSNDICEKEELTIRHFFEQCID